MSEKETNGKSKTKRIILFVVAVILLTLAISAAYGLIQKKRGLYLDEGKKEETQAGGSLKDTAGNTDSVNASGDSGEEEALFGTFTAYDLELNEVNQDILKDHDLTMVNIWATFCGPCIREMPELGEINEDYAEKGVQIVGIVMDVLASDGSLDGEQVQLAYDIIDKTGADYLHLVPSLDLYNLKLKDVTGVPETFFLDKDGNVVGDSYIGARSKSAWTEIIDGLLEDMDD